MKGIFEKKIFDIMAIRAEGLHPFPPMFHEHLEIIYVQDGTIQMQIDGIRHTVTAGQMSLVFPYVVHSYDRSPDAKAIILMFSPGESGCFARELLNHKPTNPYLQSGEIYLPFFTKIADYINSGKKECEKVASAYLSTLVGELLLSVPLKHVPDTDLNIVQKLLTYCSEHYTEQITIKSASSHLHISERYVTKIFSEKLGCSFRDHINTLRITDAQNLLHNPNLKIIEIMLYCGFQNQSSFNRIFLQECGVSPSEYRRQVMASRQE